MALAIVEASARVTETSPEEVRDAIVALAPSLASPFERTPWRLARHNIRLPSSATGPIPSPDAAHLAAALSAIDTIGLEPPAAADLREAALFVTGRAF